MCANAGRNKDQCSATTWHENFRSNQTKCGQEKLQLQHLQLIINELRANAIFSYIPRRKYIAFQDFKDTFSCINLVNLHKWITSQRERAGFEQQQYISLV